MQRSEEFPRVLSSGLRLAALKNALEELNNYLTRCPLRTQSESSRSISKNRCSDWVCIYFSGLACVYRGGSLFLRGLALPPLPPPLTGARSFIPRSLIGHCASSIPGAPPMAGSALAT